MVSKVEKLLSDERARRAGGVSIVVGDALGVYSLSRGLLAEARGDRGFEQEVSGELARSIPNSLNLRGGLLVPPEVLALRQLEVGTATGGAELVFETAGPAALARRPIPRVQALGATIVPGGSETLRIVRNTDGGTVAWIAETPASDIDLPDFAFESETLPIKLGATGVAWSRQLEVQAASMPALIETELRAAAASAIDIAAVQAGGGDQPVGLLGHSDIPTVALGTNGAAPTYATLTELEEAPAAANIDELASGWLTTPGVRRKLRDTESFTGAGAVWRGASMLGHPALVSSIVPSDLTKGTGTSLHAMLFAADWSHLVVHLQAVEIVVDPYSQKKQALIEGVVFVHVGIGVRHPTAFVRVVDADVS